MTDLEIACISKIKFKQIVKTKVRQAAFAYLKNLQQSHSKMSGLIYEKFEIMHYLNSPLFSCESRKLLLALRTRTVEGIRNDFRGQYKDILCPLGCGELDTLENILSCTKLKIHHTSDNVATSECKYSDIFSSDVAKQRQVTELYQQLLELRENLINNQPVAITGPVHR